MYVWCWRKFCCLPFGKNFVRNDKITVKAWQCCILSCSFPSPTQGKGPFILGTIWYNEKSWKQMLLSWSNITRYYKIEFDKCSTFTHLSPSKISCEQSWDRTDHFVRSHDLSGTGILLRYEGKFRGSVKFLWCCITWGPIMLHTLWKELLGHKVPWWAT